MVDRRELISGRRAVSIRSLELLGDADLVRSITEGDERAYEVLVRRYQGELYSLLLMETGSVARAEDGLQETLLTLARSASSIREPDRVRGWLRQVARNTVRHRTATRRARRERDELGAGRYPDGRLDMAQATPLDEDPAARLVDGDPELDRAIRSLPMDQRRAIWLCDVQGWTHGEVAEVYEVSPNTVSSWVRRGHQRLARELVEGGSNETTATDVGGPS